MDVAKALAGASLGAVRAMAIPTTLSGAEMTRVHRQAAGAPEGAANVRPAVVVNDPALSASQPEPELAASALNALGHAAEGPCTPRANPVSTLAALEAARLIVGGFPTRGGPDRDTLALAALLAGYTIDSTVYGLHHVLSQTLVRLGGIGHGPANAIMLPHSLGALAWRFPAWIERLGEEMGGDPAEFAAAAVRAQRRHAAGRARRRRGGARRVRRRRRRAARARPHAPARGPSGAARALRRRAVARPPCRPR